MDPRVSVAASLVSLALVVNGDAPAFAQSGHGAAPASSSAPAPDQARAIFDDGVHFMEDGRFAEAVDRFERARALRETPAVIFNLAIAQRGLGRYVDAAAGLERYLTVAGDRLEAARRTEIQTLLGDLRTSIVHARVRVAIEGASVTVDGRAVTAAQLAQPIDLDPGSHSFRATREGYRADESIQVLRAGEPVEVVLTPEHIAQVGSLRVESTVAAARVYVDHRLVGTGVYESTVPAGQYAIEVRAPGYVTYSRTVIIRGSASETVHVTLDSEFTVVNRWWFWTAVGVVAAGAGVGLYFALRPEDPFSGTLQNVVQAIQPR
ncbi:MAG: PEGA domain-containing protein [Deltaproteobacteria bacterium]